MQKTAYVCTRARTIVSVVANFYKGSIRFVLGVYFESIEKRRVPTS